VLLPEAVFEPERSVPLDDLHEPFTAVSLCSTAAKRS